MNIYVKRKPRKGQDTRMTKLRTAHYIFHREMIIQQRENQRTIILKLKTACIITLYQITILNRGNYHTVISRIIDNLYEKSEKSINTIEGFSQNSYNPPQLSEECYVVLQNFKGEDINEIIRSVNDNLFRKLMLDRWIKLQEHATTAMHTLKDHLSYYLGKLKSPYSVDGNIEREQVRNSNHSINRTMRILEEY
ncbi:hypothetical protein C922_05714 [Plasmodium inui San Antonio 1]|uniref:Plasmodium RESA N-terminal domain-containing protein n=1 Tax=Plasmodium inui San Antonio 1 TaxID=1237626 RepID=W7AF47_9APIC|nr:hypothetical protein C922_05714 [Plasmodium inui San Antonio 1]EUD63906.1 hypothetical protein C922_05714 [Plasmodium inui San Antonio 1]